MKRTLTILLLCSIGCISLFAEEPETARLGKVSRTGIVRLVGNLHPDRDALMDTEVGGLVEEVLVDTGDEVKKGDVLITLSSIMVESMLISARGSYDALVLGFSEYKPYFTKQASTDTNELFLRLNQARKVFEFEKREFERTNRLFEKGAIAESEFNGIKNRFDLAEITVQQAQAAIVRQRVIIGNLKRDIAVLEKQKELLKIRAPFTGKIVDVFTEAGQKIPGDPGGDFLRIVNDQKVIYRAGVPEEFYGQVKKGNMVELNIPGRDKPLSLKVARVSPVVDLTGRTFDIEVDIDNEAGTLKLGLFCRGDLQIIQEGLAVESSFVRREEHGDFVMLQDGTLKKVKVTVSPRAGELFISGSQIIEGLTLIK